MAIYRTIELREAVSLFGVDPPMKTRCQGGPLGFVAVDFSLRRSTAWTAPCAPSWPRRRIGSIAPWSISTHTSTASPSCPA